MHLRPISYCVTNMPGAVTCTATLALNNVTVPHVVELAEHGREKSFRAIEGPG